MTTIVMKSTCGMKFTLSNGKVVNLEAQGILNHLDEDTFALLMQEYGTFIKKRMLTESNPSGCFIIAGAVDYAKDMSKEVGEIKDNSAPIEVNEDGLDNLMDLEKTAIEVTKKVNKSKKKK